MEAKCSCEAKSCLGKLSTFFMNRIFHRQVKNFKIIPSKNMSALKHKVMTTAKIIPINRLESSWKRQFNWFYARYVFHGWTMPLSSDVQQENWPMSTMHSDSFSDIWRFVWNSLFSNNELITDHEHEHISDLHTFHTSILIYIDQFLPLHK